MRTVAFDTETHKFAPGLAAPPMVCMTWAERVNGVCKGYIADPDTAREYFEGWLDAAVAGDLLLVGHNVAYDLAVACAEWPELVGKVFAAFDSSAIRDTMISCKLYQLAQSKVYYPSKSDPYVDHAMDSFYSLGYLAEKLVGLKLDKSADSWRQHYELLDGVPLDLWPKAAVHYAVADAEATLKVWEKIPETVDEAAQARSAWGLHLMTTWGVRVDQAEVEALRQRKIQEKAELLPEIIPSGILRPDGTADTKRLKELVVENWDGPGAIPRTDKGELSTSAKFVLVHCKGEVFKKYVKYKRAHQVNSTYLKALKTFSGDFLAAINSNVDTLLATGRTSMSSPNLQNIPRDAGVRECFVPRPGMVFCAADFDTAEMRAFGQVLHDYGFKSPLTRVFDDPDYDPHLYFAARMMRKPLEELQARKDEKLVKDNRRGAKALNFSVPGGAGAKTIKATYPELLRGWSVAEVEGLRQLWIDTYNIQGYLDMMSDLCSGDNYATMHSFRSGRVRSGMRYTQACNNPFQSLVGDGSKLAIYNICRAMYTQPDSPLYGSRLVLYIHDELLMESPVESAPEAAVEMARIMRESMEVFTPDVPAGASPVLMDRWYKTEAPVYDENGRLLVYSARG